MVRIGRKNKSQPATEEQLEFILETQKKELSNIGEYLNYASRTMDKVLSIQSDMASAQNKMVETFLRSVDNLNSAKQNVERLARIIDQKKKQSKATDDDKKNEGEDPS